MFFLVVGGVYTLIQTYFYLKAKRFVKIMFSGKSGRVFDTLLPVFFLWINIPMIYMMVSGYHSGPFPGWQMYGFIMPFYAWVVTSIGMLILFLLKDIPVFVIRLVLKTYRAIWSKLNPTKTITEIEFDPRRRKFLHLASASLAVPPLGIATYGLVFGSKEIYANTVSMHFPQLPENLRGLKIAQFSDIHCSPYTTGSNIAKAVKIINDFDADLVLLTGDYVPRDPKYIYPCIDELKQLKGKYGVYATVGNHEHWANLPLIVRVIEKEGIPVLHNMGTTLTINDEKLNLLGVDDARWGRADLDRAMRMVSSVDRFNILMSHQPPYFDYAHKRGVDLTLSGHTHGGQITVNLIGNKISMGEMFHKYNKGIFEKGDSRLFVSTGFGFTGPPIRFNVPPEVVLLTLT